MPTPNNNIEIFDIQNEIFPSFSANNVKTTNFDFFFSNGEIFPYLLQPAVQISSVTKIKSLIMSKKPTMFITNIDLEIL